MDVARSLIECKNIAIIDEFTSVVDRTVAQIGSAAIAKTVRKTEKKFIAVSCHYDILEWLEPDWVLEPHTGEFYTGRYLRRPKIQLDIRKVNRTLWGLFRQYHYLDTVIHSASQCFCAFTQDRPVAFTAALHFPPPIVT